MTADDLTRLRAVAEATATNGQIRSWEWRAGNNGGYPQQVISIGDVTLIAETYEGPDFPSTIAEFIATFDPVTAIALIDSLERAERGYDGATAAAAGALFQRDKARDELAALRAAVAGLADEWECSDPDGRYGYSATVHREACMWCRGADELRALLTEGADDGQ